MAPVSFSMRGLEVLGSNFLEGVFKGSARESRTFMACVYRFSHIVDLFTTNSALRDKESGVALADSLA